MAGVLSPGNPWCFNEIPWIWVSALREETPSERLSNTDAYEANNRSFLQHPQCPVSVKERGFAALCSSFILVSAAFDLRAVSETIYKAYHSSNFQKRPVGCIELGKAAVGGNLWQRFLEDRLFAQSGEPV